jgi:hypothetical protein
MTYLRSALTRSVHCRMAAAGPPASPGGHRGCLLRGAAIVTFGQFLAGPKPGTDSARRRPLNGPRRCAAAVGAPYRQPSASGCTVLE